MPSPKNFTVQKVHLGGLLRRIAVQITPEAAKRRESLSRLATLNTLQNAGRLRGCNARVRSNTSACRWCRASCVRVACATDASGTRGRVPPRDVYGSRTAILRERLARPVHDSRDVWQALQIPNRTARVCAAHSAVRCLSTALRDQSPRERPRALSRSIRFL